MPAHKISFSALQADEYILVVLFAHNLQSGLNNEVRQQYNASATLTLLNSVSG